MGKVKRLDEETNMGGRRERQRGEKAIYEQQADILDACFIFFYRSFIYNNFSVVVGQNQK